MEWPIADPDVLAALEAAYRDGSWGRYHGPHGQQLIEELRSAFHVDYALLCSSGTIGVELALRGCGIGAGDEVVLAGYDFPGNFRAIEAVGARPVLVDVAANGWCLCTNALQEVSSDRVKAVIVSHLHGTLAEISTIMELARQRGWLVVEDACQQPGALIDGAPVGSFGDVGVLSFGGSKLLTAGRGGAVLTKDATIHQRMKVYAERGNWAFPLSELQAAVLRPQLFKLKERNRTRLERVELIVRELTALTDQLRPPAIDVSTAPAFYKLPWTYVPAEEDGDQRDRLLVALQMAGAPIDVGFSGFTQRSQRRCDRVGSLENSRRASQSTILLHHPILLAHDKAAHQLVEVLRHVVGELTG